jgi:prefoldin subunit 5
VARVGLDLGENQAALVKKVEELTLYILDQNKKIEEMGRRMEEMQRQLKKRPPHE